MRQTIRDQAGCLQDLLVSSRAFQYVFRGCRTIHELTVHREAMLVELRGIRGSLGQPSVGRPPEPTAPPLRTTAAVRKVYERSAKARGKEIVLTSEEIDHDHHVRLMVVPGSSFLTTSALTYLFAEPCSDARTVPLEDQQHI